MVYNIAMRVKNSVVMIAILSLMLILTVLGALNRKKDDVPEVKPSDDVVVVNDSVPESFKGNIDDTYGVPAEIMDLICSYMDSYYRSIYTLEEQDFSPYFSNDLMKEVSEKAIRLLIENRKQYDFDFRMNSAHYDLKVFNYKQENNVYHVDVMEDDYMSFVFLNGLESQAFDIENYFEIVEDNGTYKIKDLEKVQGYYMGIYEEAESVEKVEETYQYFLKQLKDMYAYNSEILKPKAQDNPYSSTKTYTINYDRAAAVAYADKYYHSRNPEWYNFTDEGGNCQNYASQSILSGGLPMDYNGDLQWKCFITDPEYDPEINGEETKAGRTRSWVNVGYFYNYCKDNEGKGLVADVNANIYYAQPGDIIMVGNYGLSHTVIVSKVVDGHVLVNSNSIDMKDYPIEAYAYTNIMLIKILGSN